MQDSDHIHDELKRDGWSLAEFAFVGAWVVTGERDIQRFYATDETQEGAWRDAQERARKFSPCTANPI